MLTILLILIAVVLVSYAAFLCFDLVKNRHFLEPETSWKKSAVIGFIANFFDTLGIGSFAVTTTLLKIFRQAKDIDIPGTLNVACAIPAIVEALIFIKIIQVDFLTLVSMMAASAVGAWFGAAVVSKLPEKKIQIAMGIALLVTALVMLIGGFGWLPVGGNAIGLSKYKLAIGIFGNLIIGSLSAVGIGAFAPCMALVYFLGMSQRVAFPIMMGSCAVLMPAASIKFIKENAFNRKASFAIATAGVIGVLIAAYIVKSLPLNILHWLVIGIIIYASLLMFYSAKKKVNKSVCYE